MRAYNGLHINDIVYYNNDKSKKYVVKALKEKGVCEISLIGDEKIQFKVSVALCEKI